LARLIKRIMGELEPQFEEEEGITNGE